MQSIQGDVANAPSAALAKVMTRVIPQNELQREAVRYLSQWNGSMDRESVGASIFVTWSDGLRRRIFGDELEGPWNRRGKTRQLESLSGRMQDAELAALEDGWNGHDSAPIDPRALDVLRALCVVPTARGGIQIEWHVNGWDVEIEVDSDGWPVMAYMERTR